MRPHHAHKRRTFLALSHSLPPPSEIDVELLLPARPMISSEVSGHLTLPGEMQDLHQSPDRACGAQEGGTADGGGDQLHRLVGHPTAASRKPTPPQLAKCPRCNSTNTKFCYYNNYNLSQPRHFCKSCRRYWTMGGVLRNVPVGGGCRKFKRHSSWKPSSLPFPSSADKDHPRRRRPCGSASTLTPATTAAAFPSIPDPPLPAFQTPMISCTDAPLHPAPAIFRDPLAEGFSDTPVPLLWSEFPDPSPAEEQKTEAHPTKLPLDPKPSGSGDGFPALDWSGQVEPGPFDLTSAVDLSTYGFQSHWMDVDPSLYLP